MTRVAVLGATGSIYEQASVRLTPSQAIKHLTDLVQSHDIVKAVVVSVRL